MRSVLLLASVLGAQFVPVRSAFASGNQCADAAEDAQRLRDDGMYRRAREQLIVCARPECPSLVRRDCNNWLAEVEREGPTLVLGAKNSHGDDEIDVRVSMDGAPLLTRLDGKPVLVDSGEHKFTFTAPDGSSQSMRVVVRAAEKARPILVTLAPAAVAGPPRVELVRP